MAKANCPSVPSRISIGIKAAIVVSEATASGMKNCPQDAIAASSAGIPSLTLVWMSSTTTSPLSTKSPREMMTAATETC